MTPRWTRRRIFREFIYGLSFVGLARKYALTTDQVQQIIRKYKADESDLKWWARA